MPLLQVGASSYAVVGGLRGLSPARGLGAWGSCLNGCLDYSLGARLAMAFAGIASTMAPGVLITNASGVNAVLPALYAAYVANMDKAAPAAGARQPCCLSGCPVCGIVALVVMVCHWVVRCGLLQTRAAGIGFPNGDLLLLSSCRGNPYAAPCGVGQVRVVHVSYLANSLIWLGLRHASSGLVYSGRLVV